MLFLTLLAVVLQACSNEASVSVGGQLVACTEAYGQLVAAGASCADAPTVAEACPLSCGLCADLHQEPAESNHSNGEVVAADDLATEDASNKLFDHWLYYVLIIIFVGLVGSICIGVTFAYMSTSYHEYTKRQELDANDMA